MAAPYTVGQRVRVVHSERYSGLGTVTKVLPKNVDVTLDTGRKVRFAPFYLTAKLEPGRYEAPMPPPTAYVPTPPCGTIVTTTDKRVAGPYVVLAESTRKGETCVRIAKLGGDANRYWTFPVRLVTVVPLADLPALLGN